MHESALDKCLGFSREDVKNEWITEACSFYNLCTSNLVAGYCGAVILTTPGRPLS